MTWWDHSTLLAPLRSQTRIHVLATRLARALHKTLSLENKREQGMPGARCTRGLVCKLHKEMRTRAYRFSGGYPTFPAQWLYGLCRALPGERIRLVTVAAGLIADRPGRIDFATGSLAPATGVGTTRFCRTLQRLSSSRCDPLTDQGSALLSLCAPTLPRPTASHPRFVTIAIRPSSRVRRAN